MIRNTSAALVAVLTLSGCASLQALGQASTGTIASVAPITAVDAKKGLTAAHDLHKSVAVFLTAMADSGLCHATCASNAKTVLDQSEAALVAGDKLITLGDAPGVKAKIDAASALISQVNSIIAKGK